MDQAILTAGLRFTAFTLSVVIIIVATIYARRAAGQGRLWHDGSAMRSVLGVPLFLGLAVHQFGFFVWQLAFIRGRDDLMLAVSTSIPFTILSSLLIILGIAGILSGFLLQLFGRFWPGWVAAAVLFLVICGTLIAATVRP